MLLGRKITDDFIDKLDLGCPSRMTIGTNYEITKSSSSRFSRTEKR